MSFFQVGQMTHMPIYFSQPLEIARTHVVLWKADKIQFSTCCLSKGILKFHISWNSVLL